MGNKNSAKKIKKKEIEGRCRNEENIQKGSELSGGERLKERECKSERAGRVSMDLSSASGIMPCQTGLTTREGGWSYLHPQPLAIHHPFFRLHAHPMSG